MIITRLGHIVWFGRRVAEPFIYDTSFFLDTNHLGTLTACIAHTHSHTTTTQYCSVEFALHLH